MTASPYRRKDIKKNRNIGVAQEIHHNNLPGMRRYSHFFSDIYRQILISRPPIIQVMVAMAEIVTIRILTMTE